MISIGDIVYLANTEHFSNHFPDTWTHISKCINIRHHIHFISFILVAATIWYNYQCMPYWIKTLLLTILTVHLILLCKLHFVQYLIFGQCYKLQTPWPFRTLPQYDCRIIYLHLMEPFLRNLKIKIFWWFLMSDFIMQVGSSWQQGLEN